MGGQGLRKAGVAALLAAALIAALGAVPGVGGAHAQSTDPYSALYCEPPAATKLLYTNRAYLIAPKPEGAPPLYYSYMILGTERWVERRGQLLFDDGEDDWELEGGSDDFQLFWPLRPQNSFTLNRIDRTSGVHAEVSFMVLGLEPIAVGSRSYRSWKIRRLDRIDDGTSFLQFLWYAPDLCTLSAFTDSQHRMVRLLRVLKPGDADYGREIVHKNGRLYFANSGKRVK